MHYFQSKKSSPKCFSVSKFLLKFARDISDGKIPIKKLKKKNKNKKEFKFDLNLITRGK